MNQPLNASNAQQSEAALQEKICTVAKEDEATLPASQVLTTQGEAQALLFIP